ncbi:MAG: GNAT family N-acetyltransferase [Acidimicrobiales bacterium]
MPRHPSVGDNADRGPADSANASTTRDARRRQRAADLRWTWRTDEESNGGAGEPRDAFIERFTAFANGALAGRWRVRVAEDRDSILGCIWIYRMPKVPSPGTKTHDFGYMTNVYTLPQMRNRGIGAELLAAVTAWAHESDLEMIAVWPSERSVPWYTRGGFSPSLEMLELEVDGYES